MIPKIAYVKSDFAKGGRCEVRLKGPTKAEPFVWRGGRIKEFSGGGAFVKIDEGRDNFFWFRDMRPEPEQPKAPEPPKMPKPQPIRSLATIGDAIASRGGAHALSVVVPDAPKPPTALPLAVAKPSKMPRRKHPTSAIGNIFRSFRVREGATQQALGDLVGCSNGHWSMIELGSALPKDDILERFSTLSGYSVEELKAARDRRPIADAEPVPVAPTGPAASPQAEEPPAEPSPPEPKSEPVATPPAVQTRAVPEEGFADFCGRLDELVAVPVDRDARRRWFTLARELYALEGGR